MVWALPWVTAATRSPAMGALRTLPNRNLNPNRFGRSASKIRITIKIRNATDAPNSAVEFRFFPCAARWCRFIFMLTVKSNSTKQKSLFDGPNSTNDMV